MQPALTPGQEVTLILDTIERAAKALTKPQIFSLTNLRDGRDWDFGRSRAGGAVSRLFDRMNSLGLTEGPPYKLTKFGRMVLAERNREK